MSIRYIIDAGKDGIVNKVFRKKSSAEKFKTLKNITGRIRQLKK